MTIESVSVPPLRRNRHFTVFWAAQTLSVGGSAFAMIAVPLLVLDATGSVAQMGLVTGLTSVGTILSGIVAGPIVDRCDRRKVLIVCDLVRAGFYGAIPVVWLFGEQVWVLYLVVPLSACFGMVFEVAYVAAVVGLVGHDQITGANSRLQATSTVAYIAGPMLAGVVSGVAGPVAPMAVNAASFLVSAIGLCFVRLRPPAADGTGPARLRTAEDLRTELLTGIRFLWRHPVLRTLTLLLTAVSFMTIGLTDVLVYHVKHGLGGSDVAVGAVLGVAVVGTVAAAVLAVPLRRRLGFGPAWLGSYLLAGTAVLLVGQATNVVTLALLAAAYSAGTALAGICSMSLRQEITPEPLLGRVTSAFWTTHNVLGPVGAAVITALVAGHGVPAVTTAIGGLLLALMGIAALTPVRTRRPSATSTTDLTG